MELDLTKILPSDATPEELVQEAQEKISKLLTGMAQYGVVHQTAVYEWNNISNDGQNFEPDKLSEELKQSLSILARTFYETVDKDNSFICIQGDQSEHNFSLTDEADASLRVLIDTFYGNHVVSEEADIDIAIRLAKELIKQNSKQPVLQINNRLADVSMKPFEHALTLTPNANAFIAPLGTGIFDRFKIDPKTHQVIQLSNNQPLTDASNAIMMRNAALEALHSEYDFPLVGQLLGYIYSNPHMVHGDNFDIPCQAIADPLRVDSTHLEQFDRTIKSLEPYYGIVFNENIYQGTYAVLKFVKRDDVKKVLTLSSPYLIKILEVLKKQSERKHKQKKQPRSGLNWLIHSDIHKEKNWTAVEIVCRMTAILLQNPNKKRTKDHKREPYAYSHIRFNVIGMNTDLQNRVEALKDTRDKTRAIRASFDKAFELMKIYTDAFDYFEELQIYTMDSSGNKHFLDVKNLGKEKPKGKYAGISPTYAEYEAGCVLYFRHKGVNPKWAHERD